MIALYHYQRFLAMGAQGFEGICAHGGDEPFYPYPADGSTPKSLADLRVDCSVIITKHDSVNCKWYLSKKDNMLLGFESYLAKDNPKIRRTATRAKSTSTTTRLWTGGSFRTRCKCVSAIRSTPR